MLLRVDENIFEVKYRSGGVKINKVGNKFFWADWSVKMMPKVVMVTMLPYQNKLFSIIFGLNLV